jgi:hypothetical protein
MITLIIKATDPNYYFKVLFYLTLLHNPHAIIFLENKMGVACAKQQPDSTWKDQ